MNVSGKKAVVFGGTSGIGASAANMLADKGAQVAVVSRDPSKAEGLPASVEFHACDVLDRGAVENLLEKLAPFDILVTSATGGDRAVGPFLSMDMAGYEISFAKLWGYTNVVRFGAQHLPEDGCIVLVSGAPARRCRPGQIAVSSVGGAVEAFARGVAPELAPRRINVVSPGTIDTPIVSAQGADRTALYQRLVKGNLIERAGTADECGQAILFLIENDFVTGTTVDVDGGWILT